MNKTIKIILITLNFAMLVIAVSWYLDKNDQEPLIVIIGQVATLIVLFSERKVSEIIAKRIKNKSEVIVKVQSGDNVKTSDIDDSKVTIETK